MAPHINGNSIGANLEHAPHAHQTKPMRTVQDFLSNVSNFQIIESTLREGEQFANAFFDTETKVKIAYDYPGADPRHRAVNIYPLLHRRLLLRLIDFSEQSRRDCETIAKLGLKAKILTHVRCNLDDARLAVETGVDGVDVVVGIADTVGVATPREVYDLVRTLRGVVRCDIECHFHNDTGCAIANAYYDLTKLKAVEDLVADAVEVVSLRLVFSLESILIRPQNVPFNNPVTGFCAFTHKAGIHATYEIINPADFGMQRYVHFASRLTGWNAIKSRCDQLGLNMTDAQIKQCTAKIKAMADIRKLAIEDTDVIINQFYHNLSSEHEKPLLSDLTLEEKKAFEKKELELNAEPEMKKLDSLANAHTNGVVTDHASLERIGRGGKNSNLIDEQAIKSDE
ncbi:MAG: hypothetical protein L6R35_005690 [Caloplaca aegaea]|nr:MAG: hypothetical protein L6R35_005690 [Caloplaca aegaea]